MKPLLYMLVGLLTIAVQAEELGETSYRFKDNNWTAWGNESSVAISKEPGPDGKTVVKFSRPADKGSGWNTPMYKLEEKPAVTAFTALKFRCFSDRSGVFEVNLGDAAEGAQYAARFKTEAGKWVENVIVIKDAIYKRGGNAGIVPDGIMGDRLDGIQLAYSGKEIKLEGVELVELNPMFLPKSGQTPEFVTAYVNNRLQGDFRVFKRNAVFPVGIISTIGAGNRDNGKLFGQSTRERMDDDLRNIRLLGFNTYANFVDASGYSISERLDLMRKYHLYLIETVTCGTGLHRLPDDAKLICEIRKNADHPNLLSWYGQDEPKDGATYLKNKARLESLSSGKVPVTGAMHMLAVAKELGPAMDVISIDPYSLVCGSNPEKAADVLDTHSIMIKMSRNFCGGDRVWMIPQAFSMRHSGTLSLRYPSPAEARYDVFNSLAAGANGFIFFIYNDTVPYLDGKLRGEEFDQTMVDAWGNGNSTTDALGTVAKRLTAVMPSFLERKPAEHERKIGLSESWKAAQWQTEDGILLIVVNRDLLHECRGRIAVQLEPGEQLYDLDRTQSIPAVSELKLQPGDGALLLIARPEKWDRVKNEISARQEQHTREIASLQEDFPPELLEIRKLFGHINAMLVAPEVIQRVDAKPEWNDFRERMKASSKAYFTARREWRHDKQIKVDLDRLQGDVKKLLDEAKARIAAK